MEHELGLFGWLERYWPHLLVYSLAFTGVFLGGREIVTRAYSPEYECGSELYDKGFGALQEHGVSSRCPALVVRRRCNNRFIRQFKERAEEQGMDSFYGKQYKEFKDMFEDPYVLTIYYGVGGDRYEAFNVFDEKYYPSRVPTGFCENAPDLRWRLTEEEQRFVENRSVDRSSDDFNESVNGSTG